VINEQSIGEIISNFQAIFSDWSETPSLDIQVLLADITGKNRAWLLTHPETELTPDQQNALSTLVARLQTGEPLPYVLGYWEFYGLDFTITDDTLIPRPETELLVEQALSWLDSHPDKRRAADVGTGSGCIAVSLAAHTPDLRVTACDISVEALQVAYDNAKKHLVIERIEFVQADLLPVTLQTCDLICANLPYIPSDKLAKLAVFGKEPTLALDGGPDGLTMIRRLLPQAARCLTAESLLLLEIEASTGKTAMDLASEYFPKAQISLLSDLAGLDRLIRIETLS
jgi:release factor glutamine methyltransferase